MKSKIFTLMVLLVAAVAIAQPRYGEILAKISVTIAATDLSNLDCSEYAIYMDMPDSVVNDAMQFQGADLCKGSKFRAHAGDFVCRKPITYTLLKGPSMADIVISNRKSYDGHKKLSICTEKFNGCDVIIENHSIVIDRESMKAKGFIPDPTLR